MKHLTSVLALVSVLPLLGCQSVGTPETALKISQTAVQSRQKESRQLSAPSDRVLIQAIVSTLQDFGFEITESDVQTGLVSGSKSQASGGFYAYHADIRVTVVSAAVRDGMASVRTTFQKIQPGPDPRYYRAIPINDDTLYQKFYDRLDQSLFLAVNDS